MNRNEIPAQLLADVENYLNITWQDQATDDKIRGLIADSTVYLDAIGGGTMDYESDGLPRELLMERVRYLISDALDVFENNYMSLINQFQNSRRVMNFGVESTEQANK